ncbi:hypothetical protein H8S90_05625 [Olivibacter sp. SDN3]|uniref:hypothetical protein n=1 Tax=Olivibacter sp. SDN3 TaxID=2764720 RepID=UPI0016517FFB|nr:hypothetical protein [Olivibacter sp. SDN3]QNL51068.1 hypothetical protein H8S90_05625 [Olivibacter sp. SDN3]
MKLGKFLALIIATAISLPLLAQSEKPSSSTFSVETRVTNYIQRGYDLKIFFYPANTRMSYGVSVTGQRLEGLGKDLVFDGDNLGEISLRLSWVASLLARYHFSSDYKGFFAEFSAGIEEFKASYQMTDRRDLNGFLSPGIGYLWFPFRKDKFYIMPNISVNFLIFRPEMQHIGPATYRLRAVHPSPSLSIGWKF